MSRMAREIHEAMHGFSVNGDKEPTASFRFEDQFIGFQGHFPERKVLPGVCQIQCVKAVIGRWNGAAVDLKEIVSAKYLVPVGPGEEITCRCLNIRTEEDFTTFRAIITRQQEKVSEFRLKVRLKPV